MDFKQYLESEHEIFDIESLSAMTSGKVIDLLDEFLDYLIDNDYYNTCSIEADSFTIKICNVKFFDYYIANDEVIYYNLENIQALIFPLNMNTFKSAFASFRRRLITLALDHYYYFCNDCESYYLPSENCNCTNIESDCNLESWLKRYDYKHQIKFYDAKNCKNKLFFGIEIELENNNYVNIETLEAIQELIPVAYKHDGSLTSSNGIEVVSQPFSLDFFNENKKTFEKALDKLYSLDFTAEDESTAGMHVHISRKDIGTFQTYKLLHYVYRKGINFCKFISKRVDTSFKYCQFDNDSQSLISKSKYQNNNRYEAINLQNRDTIEFRFFQSTLDINDIELRLQFLDCLINFIKVTSLKNIRNVNLLNYAKKHKKYTMFAKFLERYLQENYKQLELL